MATRAEILGVGEILWDALPAGLFLGGAPFNVACHLRAAGLPVAMVSRVGADFLGVVQLLVYVGGILVLTLFAVMLTHRISDTNVSNRAVGRGAGLVVVGIVLVWMLQVARHAKWVLKAPGPAAPTTYGVGQAFLTDFILPFEVASIVLLAALVGAIVVSRKEVKA